MLLNEKKSDPPDHDGGSDQGRSVIKRLTSCGDEVVVISLFFLDKLVAQALVAIWLVAFIPDLKKLSLSIGKLDVIGF